MFTRRICWLATAILLGASCAKDSAADQSPKQPDKLAPPPKAPEPKDSPVPTDSPPPKTQPVEDTARYLAWMDKQGKPVKDKAREDLTLRVGDWGFFDHGNGPGQFNDRAALDRSGHVITGSEKGDWFALLGDAAVDGPAAIKRVAWFLKASHNTDKPPTLTKGKDTITLEGYLLFPPNMGKPKHVTVTATATATTLVVDKK